MKGESKYIKYVSVFVAVLFVFSTITGILKENVSAEDPGYIDVQVSKWTPSGLVTTNESWLESDVDDFQDDIDNAYTSSSNKTDLFEALLDVYIEYEIIPENKKLDDLWNFLKDKYEENEELIEDLWDEYGFGEWGEYQYCHVDGVVAGGFGCFRVPGIFYFIDAPEHYSILNYYCFLTGENDIIGDYPFQMTLIIYLGIWFPPLRCGYLHASRVFNCFTFYLNFYFGN